MSAPHEHRARRRRAAGDSRIRQRASSRCSSVDGIHSYYGKSHILHGVSLEVGRGEVVGLLGRNGVGKSTTLKAIAGLVHPSEGRVLFEGRPITGLPPHRVARLGIGYVPEERRIFPLLTVTENLRTGLDRHGVGKAQKAGTARQGLQYFPVLAERRNQAGGTLSGGEQQMLAIARAMMLEPKIMLLDEPTEGLMPRMVSQIREIIEVLHRDERGGAAGRAERAADARGQPAGLHHREGRRAPPRPGRRAARRRRRHPPISRRVTWAGYRSTRS